MKKIFSILLTFFLIAQPLNIYSMDLNIIEDDFLFENNIIVPEHMFGAFDDINNTTISTASNGAEDMMDLANIFLNEDPFDDTSVDMPLEGQEAIDMTMNMSSELPTLSQNENLEDINKFMEDFQNFNNNYDEPKEIIGEIYTDITDETDETAEEGADDDEALDSDSTGDNELKDEPTPSTTMSFFSIIDEFLFTKVYADDEDNQAATNTNTTTDTDTSNDVDNEDNTNTTSNTSTTEDSNEKSKNNSLSSNKKYYIRSGSLSYEVGSSDEYIQYLFSLIANTGIEVSLIVMPNSTTVLSVSYVSVLEELPDDIINKYNDYCIDKLKDTLPYGVFFSKDDIYYFTDIRTDEVVTVKTDEPILQLLIPLITNNGIKVCIKYKEIEQGIIYITDVILMEDLPEEIANEYKKQYKEYINSIFYNFDGYITVIDTFMTLVTDNGNFKLYSEDENIISVIINQANTNKIVRVHGYLDIDTNIIDVKQIDY